MFENIDLDNFEANLDANLEAFEKDGAVLTRPVLAEGYYPANLKDISLGFGITERVTKGNPKGEPRAWGSLQASFTLDSAIARESLKQDNNPTVFTANETTFLPQFFNLEPFGFTQEGNGQFWQFIGSILEQMNLAELKIEDGAKTYLINGDIIRAIYNDKYKEEVRRLYGLAKAGEAISDDEKKNNYLLIPAMLASVLLENITELLVSQPETRECAVLIARRVNEKTKEQGHYAKGYVLRKDIAQFEDSLLV